VVWSSASSRPTPPALPSTDFSRHCDTTYKPWRTPQGNLPKLLNIKKCLQSDSKMMSGQACRVLSIVQRETISDSNQSIISIVPRHELSSIAHNARVETNVLMSEKTDHIQLDPRTKTIPSHPAQHHTTSGQITHPHPMPTLYQHTTCITPLSPSPLIPNFATSPTPPYTITHHQHTKMHLPTLLTLILSTLPSTLAESCLNGRGTCMPPRRCLADKKGSVSTGLCSGGDDNQCCDLVGYYSCGDRGKGKCGCFG
jgi:hypothetical protein